jgi:hypothetical protein
MPCIQRSRLKAGGHFGALHCQPAMKFIRSNTLQISTFRPLDFSLCYQLGVIKYFLLFIPSKFGSLVRLALFGYCLGSVVCTSNTFSCTFYHMFNLLDIMSYYWLRHFASFYRIATIKPITPINA